MLVTQNECNEWQYKKQKVKKQKLLQTQLLGVRWKRKLNNLYIAITYTLGGGLHLPIIWAFIANERFSSFLSKVSSAATTALHIFDGWFLHVKFAAITIYDFNSMIMVFVCVCLVPEIVFKLRQLCSVESLCNAFELKLHWSWQNSTWR
jgi:hypothetical protein